LVNSAATAHYLNSDVPTSEEPVRHKDISNIGQAKGNTKKLSTETKGNKEEFKREGIKALSLKLLSSYSENPLGEQINSLEIPRWGRSFLSMVAHLSPMLGTLMLLKPLHLPKQVKSTLGLAAMYLSVWGNKRLKDFPQIAIITSLTSLIAESTKMPNFMKRSLLGLAVTGLQEFKNTVASDNTTINPIKQILKSFTSRLLQTELKLNSSLPISSIVSDKVHNPLLKTGLKIFTISSIITMLSETFRALGFKNFANNDDSLISSSGCPICGSSNVGECISSDIAPAASIVNGL